MNDAIKKHVDLLLCRYPQLVECQNSIQGGYEIMEHAFSEDHKLLVAGNGGSAADSEHIAGELMKHFRIPRPIQRSLAEKLISIDGKRGPKLVQNLERSLMAIPLVAHEL